MPWRPAVDPDAGGDEPRPLTEVLDQVLAGLGAPSADVIVAIVTRWSELVGAEVAPHVAPVAVEHGRLSLVADSPAWASHVRWSEPDLLNRLADLVGPGVVTTVALRVARR